MGTYNSQIPRKLFAMFHVFPEHNNIADSQRLLFRSVCPANDRGTCFPMIASLCRACPKLLTPHVGQKGNP